VYTRGKGNSRLLLGVYVDDLVVTGEDQQEIARFKEQMKNLFKMSDLGMLTYYLGIEVTQSARKITLCQSTYAGKLLEKAGLINCTPSHVPMEPRLKLSKNSSGEPLDATMYSRPDIAFAVGFVSRFMEKPTTEHLVAVKQLLRYIAGTRSFGCVFTSSGKLELIGYSDANLAATQLIGRAQLEVFS
jgi:hypothetical protein